MTNVGSFILGGLLQSEIDPLIINLGEWPKLAHLS
jgi:hypothetical protein